MPRTSVKAMTFRCRLGVGGQGRNTDGARAASRCRLSRRRPADGRFRQARLAGVFIAVTASRRRGADEHDEGDFRPARSRRHGRRMGRQATNSAPGRSAAEPGGTRRVYRLDDADFDSRARL